MDRQPLNPSEQLREAIESVAEAAWGSWPSSDAQNRELMGCVFGDGDGILGSTFVAPPTRLKLRELAEAADCWWTWNEYGEPQPMTMAAAQALFRDCGATTDPLVRVCRIWLKGETGIVTAGELADFIRAQRGECTCGENGENDKAGETVCQRRPGGEK